MNKYRQQHIMSPHILKTPKHCLLLEFYTQKSGFQLFWAFQCPVYLPNLIVHMFFEKSYDAQPPAKFFLVLNLGQITSYAVKLRKFV